MKEHSCRVYFSIDLPCDVAKNAELLRLGRDCEPEEIGIFTKSEVEKFIAEELGVPSEWRRHHFVIGERAGKATDVSELIRETLRELIGKESKIREIGEKWGASAWLEIVPYISAREPHIELSLDSEVIRFLCLSGASVDYDYYVG